VVYGSDPPSVRSYTSGKTQLIDRDKFLVEIKDRLEQAQQHYKAYYDCTRDAEYQVSQWL
jgi:hypothetical protein